MRFEPSADANAGPADQDAFHDKPAAPLALCLRAFAHTALNYPAGWGTRAMEWRRKYVIMSYIRGAVWIAPLLAYVTSFMLIRLLTWLDDRLGWDWSWTVEVGVAQAMLQVFVAAMLSFIVFTSSSMLVAIQIASAQLTPRIIATTLLRDNTIRSIIALFVLTFTFNLGVLARTQVDVPYLIFTVALLLTVVSVAAFLYLIDYAARLMRPVTIVWLLGERALEVIEEVYPSKLGDTRDTVMPPALDGPAVEIRHRRKSAIVLACDLETMKREAARVGGVIELVIRVGDFVATGEVIYRLYGKALQANEPLLRQAVAMGRERTIEQDPTFAFRIIVDIAIKALSKAINDPTTAVLAIDQLHRLLRAVGRRHLHDDFIHPVGGGCMIFKTPDWSDFVELSCREIRFYGAENFQVARRMRAMLENLIEALPERRAPTLRRELDLLDQSIDCAHVLLDDRQLSKVPDLQGLGSSARANGSNKTG
jgi:uncharacterized membrane protein